MSKNGTCETCGRVPLYLVKNLCKCGAQQSACGYHLTRVVDALRGQCTHPAGSSVRVTGWLKVA